MGILFLIIFVIASVLLILVVMVQDEQGEGVGGIFGGGSSTAFGSRSGNILTRITAIIAGVFLCSALVLTYINRSPSETTLEAKARLKQLQENTSQWKYQVKPESENTTNTDATKPQTEGSTGAGQTGQNSSQPSAQGSTQNNSQGNTTQSQTTVKP